MCVSTEMLNGRARLQPGCWTAGPQYSAAPPPCAWLPEQVGVWAGALFRSGAQLSGLPMPKC